MSKLVLYFEQQRFTQWWLWIIIIGIAVLLFPDSGILKLDSIQIIVRIVLPLLFVVFFCTLKLTTRITPETIKITYYPLFTKKFNWTDIQQAQIIDYGFIGGWGIRLGTDYGTVYNVKGTKGLHIKVNGKQYVIGTQNEQQLGSIIEQLQQ